MSEVKKYEPAELWGIFGTLRLFSAFQVLSGAKFKSIDKATYGTIISKCAALKIIGKLTGLDVLILLKGPGDEEDYGFVDYMAEWADEPHRYDLKTWLDWLAVWAEYSGQMDWWQPYAWAVPAAFERGEW